MAEAEILSAIRLGSTTYLPGNTEHAEAFLAVCNPQQAERLLGLGVVAGTAFEVLAQEMLEPIVDPSLPAGFPSRQILITAGFDTVGKVRAATDEVLAELKGVGDSSIAAIRNALS